MLSLKLNYYEISTENVVAFKTFFFDRYSQATCFAGLDSSLTFHRIFQTVQRDSVST